MPHPLNRGTVVMRDGRFGVVWEVRGHQLVLLPVLRPRHRLAVDVALDPDELAACGVTIAEAVIRLKPGTAVDAAGHAVVGVLPARVPCRVTMAMIRNHADAANDRKWSDEARHSRQVAGERCVNLLR